MKIDPTVKKYLRSLPVSEAATMTKRLDDLRDDCGCVAGSLVMFSVTGIWIVRESLRGFERMPWWEVFGRGLAVIVFSGLIGKLLGLALAQLRFYLLVNLLRRRSIANPSV